MTFWTIWWVWLSAALVLAILEVLAPGFIFLGFAVGGLVMAGIVAVFGLSNAPALLALFAIASLIAWIALKAAFRRQSSGARIVTKDINDH